MLPLAITTMEKIQKVPRQIWINAAILVGLIVLSVIIIRRLREMNKIVLVIILAMAFSIVGFSWIYERNEPEFLTPTIDVIAQFFPSKGSYGEKQKKEVTDTKSKPAPKPQK